MIPTSALIALVHDVAAVIRCMASTALTWLGVTLPGSAVPLAVVAVLDAVVGMACGLFASAFARAEFQAVHVAEQDHHDRRDRRHHHDGPRVRSA